MVINDLPDVYTMTLNATYLLLNELCSIYRSVVLKGLNHCYWERKCVFKHQHLQMLVLKLTNMSNFQPLEVVDRRSETQPQVVENSKKLSQQDRG